MTKQIIVASKNIIRNETTGVPSDSTTLALGYDKYTGEQFGNKDFIQNAVLYLTGNEAWLQLRSRTFKLCLLNKNIVENDAVFWQMVNVVCPLVLLGILGTIFIILKKRKYAK